MLCRLSGPVCAANTAVFFLVDAAKRAERAVPNLATWSEGDTCTDAVMDLVCRWPGRVNQYLIDVTIRSPHAVRYGVSEDITGRASREKHTKYGSTVWPLASTTYGRIGEEGEALISVVICEARAAGASTPAG